MQFPSSYSSAYTSGVYNPLNKTMPAPATAKSFFTPLPTPAPQTNLYSNTATAFDTTGKTANPQVTQVLQMLITIVSSLIQSLSGQGSQFDETNRTSNGRPGAPSSETPSTGSSSGRSSSGSTGSLFSGGKEGLGVGGSNGDGSNLSSTKASWYYNWSPNASSKVNDPNATFIPMIWGKGNMNDKDLAAAKNSKSPMILTFNEPDLGSQGNMSPDEALGYWDKLEATGKKLSSPAITNGPDGAKWLDEFMTKAKASGKQVDSISLHWYGSSAQPTNEKVAAMKSYIEGIHKKYPDKPINLTEFGVDASGLTAGKDQAFLTAAEKMLNGLDYVQMYAPYGAGDINGN
jgi:hypothetical protein